MNIIDLGCQTRLMIFMLCESVYATFADYWLIATNLSPCLKVETLHWKLRPNRCPWRHGYYWQPIKSYHHPIQQCHRRFLRLTVQPQYRMIGIAECVMTLQCQTRLMIFMLCESVYATFADYWLIATNLSPCLRYDVLSSHNSAYWPSRSSKVDNVHFIWKGLCDLLL